MASDFVKFGPRVPAEKVDEALALFVKAHPAPEGMTSRAWVNRYLTEHFAQVISQGIWKTIQDQTLASAAAYYDPTNDA